MLSKMFYMGASHCFCIQPVVRKAPSIPRVSGATSDGYNIGKRMKSHPESFLTYPWDAGGITTPKKTSKIYSKFIDNQSKTYGKSIEHLLNMY